MARAVSISKYITAYLTKTRGSLIAQMKAQRFYLSGETANNIVINDASMFVPGYVTTFINGRPPGKMPPIEPIRRWVEKRHLAISPWAIAIKMKNEGNAVFRGDRAPLKFEQVFEVHKKELMRNIGDKYMTSISDMFKQKLK